MEIEKNDLEKFKKLGIQNILELSIIAPVKYFDYQIKNYIPSKMEGVFDVKIKDVFKSKKLLRATAYSFNLQKEIEIIFFKYSRYHESLLQKEERLYFYGKVEQKFLKIQLIQPKKISKSKIDKIYPSYKITIRSDIFRRLIERYVSKENLIKEGVLPNIAKNIELIHFPTPSFLDSFQKNGGYKKEFLEALKFVEIFNHLKMLKKKRRVSLSIMSCKKEIEPFLKNLPFLLTNDQLKAIYDIKNDLEKKVAAKRVIVGDVGSGKSIIMFATAFLAYPNRAILMAPTTILANQLYEEAKKYLPAYIRIALVTSASKDESLKNSHFIIGTHALLYKELPKACAIMVDEQHRFGTNQRYKLKQILKEHRKSPHYFQFSATPIPRTKALIDSSLVDFSFIKETPFKKDITTKVISDEDFKELLIHIKNEIKNNRQVLIVYPLIESSKNYKYKSLEEAKFFWKKHFKNIYITHGKDRDKEEVLIEFREKGDILLSTTVIEVGISLPRLSTIIIVGAENLGLATLHQLRGRVSRVGLKGYCFLYTKDKKNKRLNLFSKINSGFEIAELDLRFRKSGDLLTGKEQSGKSFKWIDLGLDEEIIKRVKKIADSL